MNTLYIAYLDEFGHAGPFVSRNDPRYRTSPVFGLGGFVLPSDQIRSFATWFYQLKCRLLRFEIDRSGEEPYRWEKKGSALYTTKNVTRYRELRQATFRILNHIERIGGMVFYVGIQKTHPPDRHNSKRIYRALIRETIKRLNQHAYENDTHFMMILDEHAFRTEIVEEASIQMFGDGNRDRLIEPPLQVESHLYQTLQCADWLCGLIGRFACYEVLPEQYPDLEWSSRYFRARLLKTARRSGIRKDK